MYSAPVAQNSNRTLRHAASPSSLTQKIADYASDFFATFRSWARSSIIPLAACVGVGLVIGAYVGGHYAAGKALHIAAQTLGATPTPAMYTIARISGGCTSIVLFAKAAKTLRP